VPRSWCWASNNSGSDEDQMGVDQSSRSSRFLTVNNWRQQNFKGLVPLWLSVPGVCISALLLRETLSYFQRGSPPGLAVFAFGIALCFHNIFFPLVLYQDRRVFLRREHWPDACFVAGTPCVGPLLWRLIFQKRVDRCSDSDSTQIFQLGMAEVVRRKPWSSVIWFVLLFGVPIVFLTVGHIHGILFVLALSWAVLFGLWRRN
jgi:hypothetical protein